MTKVDRDFDLKAFANAVVMRKFPFPLIADPSGKPQFIVSLDQSLGRLALARKLLLPDLQLQTKTVFAFSDYSGESADSRFVTYSFLFTSWDAHPPILNEFRALRCRHGLIEPFKEVCFKDSEYGPINRALKEWLRAADCAVGLVFTLVVDKNVTSLFGQNHRDSQRDLARLIDDLGLGSWKPAVAEKLIRIIHVVSYWLAALTNSEQNVCWMTDEDAVAANPARVGKMQKILDGVMNSYRKKSGKIGTALPFPKTADAYGISDFLSIPDLVAGSVESLFTRSEKMGEPTIRTQANEVLLWLSHQGVGLKKLTMTITAAQDGRIQTSITVFERKDGDIEGECIPVTI